MPLIRHFESICSLSKSQNAARSSLSLYSIDSIALRKPSAWDKVPSIISFSLAAKSSCPFALCRPQAKTVFLYESPYALPYRWRLNSPVHLTDKRMAASRGPLIARYSSNFSRQSSWAKTAGVKHTVRRTVRMGRRIGRSPLPSRRNLAGVGPLHTHPTNRGGPAYSPAPGSDPSRVKGCCIRRATRHAGASDRCKEDGRMKSQAKSTEEIR